MRAETTGERPGRRHTGVRGDSFHYHKPGESGSKRLAENRKRFRDLRDYLLELPQTKEMSRALDSLQEAAMFSNAAIALTDPEAEVVD